MPLPIRQFVIKLHSRCNLACNYCYVYEMADQRWRGRPRTMSRELVDRTVDRIAEHAGAHSLGQVDLVVHGGEPLLAGPAAIEHLVLTARRRIPATVRVSLQTNATLLDDEYLDLFGRLDIRVGVSVDGDARANDRHRRGHDGVGSWPAVHDGLRRLASAEHRPIFAGLLCTVDVRNDPVRTYESLLEFEPPTVDFLLPHGNWTNPPPGRGADTAWTPYADWLIAVFDRWFFAHTRETGIRVFDELLHVLLGGRSRVEGVGLSPALQVVIETDGSIEQSDILASTFEGAAMTGLHVRRDSFDAALRFPDLLARQAGLRGLSRICRACDLAVVCGGGLRAHRYRARTGFDNPSVYCADLTKLIRHVRGRLVRGLSGIS